MPQIYTYRKVNNHWVTVRIKEQSWVRWFKFENHAIRWTRLVNLGMPTSCTGFEPEWREK